MSSLFFNLKASNSPHGVFKLDNLEEYLLGYNIIGELPEVFIFSS